MATEKGRLEEAVIHSEPDQAAPAAPVAGGPAESSRLEGADSTEIRREIERTRAEMDQTFDELSERLSPRHLLDELIDLWQGNEDRTRGARRTIRETGTRLAQNVKDHPIPAALIGAGLAWLMIEEKKPARRAGFAPEPGTYGGSYVDARTGEPYDPEGYGAEWRGGRPLHLQYGNPLHPEFPEDEDAGGAGMMDRAKEKLAEAGESVRDAVSGTRERVSGMASGAWHGAADMRERAAHMRESMAGGADRIGRRMASGYERGTGTVERWLDEAPLAAGVAALAAGLAAGLALPGTRREDELMGEASHSLREQVRATSSEMMERGEEVAGRAAESAAAEARREGMGPEQLLHKAERIVSDVVETAKESARREGLDPKSVRSVAESAKETVRDEVKRQKDDMER